MSKSLFQSLLGASLAITLTPLTALAHHGVASLGTAGLEGPGARIESSSSATLPENSVLLYFKSDHSEFERGRVDGAEGKYNTYSMYGLGYGVTSYASLYLFVPYHVKIDESNTGTAGFADISLMGVVGFTYDNGLKLIPKRESLDDLEDWHFTLYSGLTLPTGNDDLKDGSGTPHDAGAQLGFGKSSYTLGTTATKQMTDKLTTIIDLSTIRFQEHDFSGEKVKFGDEARVNLAGTYKFFTNPKRKLRIDGALELNYLSLGRDEVDGKGERGTGGEMVYGTFGVRMYQSSSSLGLGVKLPLVTNLNEESEQQGAEGVESYRLIFTLSTLF